jgi:folate-dependent phosphoribosylglycinamide formyltransferase PurN
MVETASYFASSVMLHGFPDVLTYTYLLLNLTKSVIVVHPSVHPPHQAGLIFPS